MSAKKSGPSGPAGAGGSSAAKRRIAEQRAAQAAAKKAKERRHRVVVVVSVTVIVAIVAAGALALVGLTSNNGGAQASTSTGLSAQVLKDVTNVPASTLNTIGSGGVSAVPASLSAPALTAGGHPEVLYIGAEYCPYCAAERWPMVVALSRFGHFTDLGATASSADDSYPSTQTLSFEGASYTSKYVDFVGKEVENVQEQPLDKLTSSENALYTKYDAPPYVSAAGKGAIPFVDIGGRYLISGAEYNPQLLQGKSRAQIASALSSPSSTIGQAIGGTANTITAAICKTTKNAPSTVCSAPGVVAAAKNLK